MTLREMATQVDIREALPDGNLSSMNREWNTDCPWCGKSGHFYVNLQSKLFFCQRCKEKGGVMRLLTRVGRLDLVPDTYIDRNRVQARLEIVGQKEDQLADVTMHYVHRPVGWKRINKNKYLDEYRRFTAKDYEVYEVGESDFVPQLRNRIAFAIEPDGDRIGAYIGRWAAKVTPPGKLRYWNPYGFDFGRLLYGFEGVQADTEAVILVEGVFDKIAVDRCLGLQDQSRLVCLATFGNRVTRLQIRRLLDAGINRVYLVYDHDAVREIKHTASELNRYFTVEVNHTSGKDPDECTPAELIAVFDRLQSPETYYRNALIPLKIK